MNNIRGEAQSGRTPDYSQEIEGSNPSTPI